MIKYNVYVLDNTWGNICIIYTIRSHGSTVVRRVIMTRTRRFVITVWLVAQSTVINMNAIEWADVCAIEHNVYVWGDPNFSVLYLFPAHFF